MEAVIISDIEREDFIQRAHLSRVAAKILDRIKMEVGMK